MNIDTILSSLPSREDISNAISHQMSDKLGLEQRSHTSDLASALGIFGTGMLFGAGLALLFAPKSGQQMRRDLSEGMHRYGDQARSMAESAYGSDRQMASQGAGQQGQFGQSRPGQEHGAGSEPGRQAYDPTKTPAQNSEYGRQMSGQQSPGSDAQRTGTNPAAGRQMGHTSSEVHTSSTPRTGGTGTGSRNV